MLARIGLYLLFLIGLVIYIGLLTYLQNYNQKRQERTPSSRISTFMVNQLQILSGLIPIVMIPYILTGFFNPRFLLLILAAFEISSMLTYVLGLRSKESGLSLWAAEMLRLPSVPDADQLRRLPLKTLFQTYKRLLVLLFVLILTLFGLVTYFIIATYLYFNNPLHSDIAVRKILTLNLGLYLIGALLAAIIKIAQMASPQLNDNTRRALFLTQAADALQIGVILTVYLGLIGIRGETFVPQSLMLPAAYTDYVPFIVLTTFYLLILVAPYLTGLASRRRAQISLYQTILKWITSVIEIVGIPGQRDPDQLAHLREEPDRETETWIENEPMVRDFAVKIERAGSGTDQLSKPLQDLVPAYHASKNQDSRFVRFTWTEAMRAKLDEMIDEYNRFASQPNQMEMYIMLGGAYERFFRGEHRQYEDKLNLAEGRKVLAPVLARVAGVLGAVPVVLQYGQKIIGFLPFTR